MRQATNRRMRGGRTLNNRNNNSNKPHQPSRNQVFESNGPEVKVRGNPMQVYEKYMSLGRDANASGDPIKAEAYYQHAEHYLRLANGFRPERDNNQQREAREPRDQREAREPREPRQRRDRRQRQEPRDQASFMAQTETSDGEDHPTEATVERRGRRQAVDPSEQPQPDVMGLGESEEATVEVIPITPHATTLGEEDEDGR